jgi:hypothetical protein
MNKDELYSFIYLELYRLTILGRYRQSDAKFIESQINNKLNQDIWIYYTDVSHGYSGEWKAYLGKKRPWKSRGVMKFDLNDKNLKHHQKVAKRYERKDSIDKILEGV